MQASDCCKGEKMTDYQSKLAKELHELRKDAERYRWLRTFEVDSYMAFGSGAKLDAAIDAAMRAEQFPGVDIDSVHRKA